MTSPNPRVAAVALLMAALICGTVLCAIGVMTKTEMLPLLGGTVVVAHRLLDATVRERRNDQERSTMPPSSHGVGVVFGMAAAGLAGTLL